jgi:hypothetical protein
MVMAAMGGEPRAREAQGVSLPVAGWWVPVERPAAAAFALKAECQVGAGSQTAVAGAGAVEPRTPVERPAAVVLAPKAESQVGAGPQAPAAWAGAAEPRTPVA